MTRALRFSKRVRRSADCDAARVMRIVLPFSSMLDDFGKDFSGSFCEHALTEFDSELFRALRVAGQLIRDDALTVETGDETFDREFICGKRRTSCNGNLAASA